MVNLYYVSFHSERRHVSIHYWSITIPLLSIIAQYVPNSHSFTEIFLSTLALCHSIAFIRPQKFCHKLSSFWQDNEFKIYIRTDNRQDDYAEVEVWEVSLPWKPVTVGIHCNRYNSSWPQPFLMKNETTNSERPHFMNGWKYFICVLQSCDYNAHLRNADNQVSVQIFFLKL